MFTFVFYRICFLKTLVKTSIFNKDAIQHANAIWNTARGCTAYLQQQRIDVIHWFLNTSHFESDQAYVGFNCITVSDAYYIKPSTISDLRQILNEKWVKKHPMGQNLAHSSWNLVSVCHQCPWWIHTILTFLSLDFGAVIVLFFIFQIVVINGIVPTYFRL